MELSMSFCSLFPCVLWQLRRERIAERMKALQELVPSANKVTQNLLPFLLPLLPFSLFFPLFLSKAESFPGIVVKMHPCFLHYCSGVKLVYHSIACDAILFV